MRLQSRLQIFKLLIICCLMKVSTSEESSIIDDAEVEGHNLDTASSQGNKALINNTYRSVMSTLSRSNRNLQVTFA